MLKVCVDILCWIVDEFGKGSLSLLVLFNTCESLLKGIYVPHEDVRLLLLRENPWSGSRLSLRMFICYRVLKGEERSFFGWLLKMIVKKSVKVSVLKVSRSEWLFLCVCLIASCLPYRVPLCFGKLLSFTFKTLIVGMKVHFTSLPCHISNEKMWGKTQYCNHFKNIIILA